MKKQNKDDLLLKMQINSLYAKYRDFMNCANLPKIDILLQDWDRKIESLRRIDFSTVTPKTNNEFLLKSLRQNRIILGRGFNAHYFHEFTHIYDFSTVAQDKAIEDRRGYLKYYTEFHATLVQMQVALGFTNATERKQIKLSEIVALDNNAIGVSNDQIVTLGEYMQRRTDNLTNDIPLWFETYIQEKEDDPLALKRLYVSLLNQSIYYFGKIYFLESYCCEDFSSIINTDIFTDTLGHEVLEIYALLKSCSVDNMLLSEIDRKGKIILNNFFEKMTGHKAPVA